MRRRFTVQERAADRVPRKKVIVGSSDGKVGRGTLLTLIVLLLVGPVVVVLDRRDAVDDLSLFLLAGAVLIPLSWLIGEATDNLAHHTGPGIGGFLNATFGNAPELIIAIVAVSDGLTEVVRASLVGSIAGNLLLVLGFTLLLGRQGAIDRLSAYVSLGVVGFAAVLVLLAAAPGFHGDPDRHSLAVLSLPVAVVLLVVRLAVNRAALRRQRTLFSGAVREEGGWPLSTALIVLGLATLVTALVTDTLVGTLQAFATQAHLSEFFVAVVIVAIVGNATEHGSAVLLARRGRVKLAVEIPLASSAQIAGLVMPLVALISWGFEPLALSFRPVELIAMALAAVLPALVLQSGGTTRLGGAVLLAAYAILCVAFYVSGDR
jgi:Ca2+:H+ antiporter